MFDDLFSEKIFEKYVNATDLTATRVLEKQQVAIGKASDLSVWMMKNAFNSAKEKFVFFNWSLDAHRSYGYKCWKADNLPNKTLTDEKFV